LLVGNETEVPVHGIDLIEARYTYFSLLRKVQAVSRAHPFCCLVGIRIFPRGKNARDVKHSLHFQLEPKSRMNGSMPPLNTFSWRCA